VLNSSVLRRLHEQECDEDRFQTTVGGEFQTAGLQTAKLRDPYRESRQHGILRSQRISTTVDVRDHRPVVIDSEKHNVRQV